MKKQEVSYRDDYKIVVRNDFITARHPERMSMDAMKLFRLTIAQCRMNDKQFYEYEFKVSDLAKVLGKKPNNIYRDAQKMCVSMMQTVLIRGSGDPKRGWKIKHIFETCEYIPETGSIRIELHREMSELLLNLLPGFTQVTIGILLSLKTKHSIRMLELISMKMMGNLPHDSVSTSIYISLDEIRKITRTEDKKAYDQAGHVKDKILMPALGEIEEAAGWKIICTNVKTGRRVTGFDLEIWSSAGYAMMERMKAKGELPVNVWGN